MLLVFRQVIIRARNLWAGANFIPSKSFLARRLYFSIEVSLSFFYSSLLFIHSTDKGMSFMLPEVKIIVLMQFSLYLCVFGTIY